MANEEIQTWLAEIFAQGLPVAVEILKKMRRNADDVADYVVVIADATDFDTRRFLGALGDGPLPPHVARFVAAVPTENVARALALGSADHWAHWIEHEPRPAGTVRLLVAARNRANALDLPTAHLDG